MTINQFALTHTYPNYDIYGGVQKCVTSAETLTSELRKLVPTNLVQPSTLQVEATDSLYMNSLTSVPTVELLKMRSSASKIATPRMILSTPNYGVHTWQAIA